MSVDAGTWTLFSAATFVIAATPGPNMLLVMSSSVKHGFRRSTATMAGCLTSVVMMMALSAAGIGGLLEAAPRVFGALKAAGAAYLAWLGAMMWRGAGAGGEDVPDSRGPREAAPGALYKEGLLVAASNPKAMLFAAAFLPQFIDGGRPQWPQFAVLVSTFAVIEWGCYTAYALGGRTMSRRLRRPEVRLWFDRAVGLLFVGFAGALLLG